MKQPTIIALAIRDLNAIAPDDYPDPEFDVVANIDGEFFYSLDFFETEAEAMTTLDSMNHSPYNPNDWADARLDSKHCGDPIWVPYAGPV